MHAMKKGVPLQRSGKEHCGSELVYRRTTRKGQNAGLVFPNEWIYRAMFDRIKSFGAAQDDAEILRTGARLAQHDYN